MAEPIKNMPDEISRNHLQRVLQPIVPPEARTRFEQPFEEIPCPGRLNSHCLKQREFHPYSNCIEEMFLPCNDHMVYPWFSHASPKHVWKVERKLR